MSVRVWWGAFFLASLVHAALVVSFINVNSKADNAAHDSAIDKGKSGIEVGLGLAGSYMDALQTPKSTNPIKELNIEVKATPSQKATVNKPVEPKVKPVHIKPAKVLQAPKDAVVIVPPKSVTKVVVDKKITAPKKHMVKEQPVTKASAHANTKSAENSQTENVQVAMQQATGSADRKRAGGSKGDAKNYFSKLMGWMNRYKKYPADLKRQKIQGVVVLKFTIDRLGHVLNSQIKKSSGNARLDGAALKILDMASPLPAIPKSINKKQLTLSIPVEYSLITK